MNCQEIFEALSDYIDEELAERKCREIERHLKTCHNCRVVVDTLRQTIALYHAIPSQRLPDEVRLRLHKIIKLNDHPNHSESDRE